MDSDVRLLLLDEVISKVMVYFITSSLVKRTNSRWRRPPGHPCWRRSGKKYRGEKPPTGVAFWWSYSLTRRFRGPNFCLADVARLRISFLVESLFLSGAR